MAGNAVRPPEGLTLLGSLRAGRHLAERPRSRGYTVLRGH